ncbi:o-succinylbenzoate synthase [Alkalimarinus coralli]|uniref:o-succinylbenzoate synthase n=1 Tax=Alkalimarinus coralli TaxID=2935863 RepID=UPI00202AE050|nr:o-succinylbenzoate synthase [Alkalimarinus coralli]
MIQRISVWRYLLPLNKPIITIHGQQSERSGLILQWHHDGGSAWSEVSPLPGFSHESLMGAQAQLLGLLAEGFIGLANNARQSHLTDRLSNRLYPSVKFGLEMGLTKLFSPLPQQPGTLSIVGLIDEAPYDAKRYELNPIVKIKVGRHSLEQDIVSVNQIIKELNGTKDIRLDANQSWSLDQAEYFLSKIPLKQISFIEEPLANSNDYSDWHKKISVPFAFDEQLQQSTFPVKRIRGLGALVIKPTLIGLQRSINLINDADRLGIQSVISASYESSLTLNFLYALALRYTPQSPPGLDTYRNYQYDLIEPLSLPTTLINLPLAPESAMVKVADYEY